MRALLFVCLIACGASTPPPATPVAAEPVAARCDAACWIAAVEDFEQRLCACKDVQCAEQIHEAFTSWNQERERSGEPAGLDAPNLEQMQAIGDATEEYKTCYSKLTPGPR